MKNYKEKIQYISDVYFRKLDFANFCVDTYFSSNCTKKKSKYKRFEGLKEYLLSVEKTNDEKKIFFIVFCMNNRGVFYKYYNLATKNIFKKN